VVIFVITYFPLEIFLLNIYISLKQSINKKETNIWIKITSQKQESWPWSLE